MAKSKEQVAEEAARCYELKLTGATVRQIVKELGLTQGTVERRLDYAIENRVSSSAEEYRKIIIDRTERLLYLCETKVQAGDLHAIQTAAGLLDKLYKFNGLESVKIEHSGNVAFTVPSLLDQELQSLVDQMDRANDQTITSVHQ